MQLALALVMSTLTGCGRFEREWKQATASELPADGIEGPWEGEWASTNGHTGRLRCILARAADGEYLARFHATFWSFCQAEYSVTLRGEERNGATHLTGQENLGWLAGGKYDYTATIHPADFNATYRSKYETGEFRMKRPEAK